MQYRISCRAFAADAAEAPACGTAGVDRCGEAIAHARHGLDVLLARGPLAERLPQHRHVVIQVVFLDRRLRPHRVEQLLLRDQPPGVLDQHQQRVEHLQTQRDHLAAAREPALADVEMKRPEPIRASDRGGRPRIAPQESFRNMPAFSKDAGARSILALWIARTETAQEENDNAETASRPELLSVADDGDAGPGGNARLRGAAQSRPDRQRRPGRAGRRSRLAGLRRSDRARRHAQRRRRAAPLRLERVQLVPVPVLAAPAHGAPLSRRARHALVAHPHPRHQARPAAAAARQGDRGRGGHAEDRLQPAAHRRTAGPTASTSTRSATPTATAPAASSCSTPRRSRSRAAGRRIAGRSTWPTTSGGTSATTR